MIRKSAAISIGTFLALAISASSFAATGGGKAEMLRILTQSVRTQIPAKAAQLVRESKQEASQLELDLVFYTWALSFTQKTLDIRYAEVIIPSLAKELKDQTASWAIKYYSSANDAGTDSPLPPRDDDRVQKLFDLKTQFRSAIDYRKSSPVQAVLALQTAAALCQDLHLDLAEALVLKHLGDLYLYDMARYTLAEACYERPAWIFHTYRCWATAARVYDDFAYLNTETGRYGTATEYYIESARNWEQMANQDPSRYKFRDLAGRQYIKAGIAARDYTRAVELMRTKGIGQIQIWAVATKSYDVLIRSLVEVADFCRTAGDSTASYDLLKQAQKNCELQSDPLLTAKVMADLAKTYAQLKQPTFEAAALDKRDLALKSAVREATAALDKLSKGGGPDQKGLLVVAERGARAYQELGNNARSADVWRRTAAAYKRAGIVDGQIRCLRELGSVLDISQNPREALEARREAVMLARGAGQSALAASVVQEMIQSFIALDDLDNALEGFTELTPIIEEAGNIRGAAQVLEARGQLLAKHGHPEEAIRDLSNARSRYLEKVGDTWSAARVALDLAKVQASSGKAEEARATLESGINDIDSGYSYTSLGSGGKADRLETVQNLYRELIRSYVLSNHPELATELVRKGRRYAWLSRLVVTMRSETADPSVAAWAKATDVIVIDDPTSEQQDTGEKVLARDWATFAETCFWLQQQHARQYDALPIDPLELLKRRASLPDGVLVVLYMPAAPYIYAFVCGREKAVCRQIRARGDGLEPLVTQLRKTLRNCEESMAAGIMVPPMATWEESSFLEIEEPLSALYTQLVAPLKEDISGSRRLAFALPDSLTGLPMHALIASEQASQPRFLMEDYEISYLTRGMLDDIAGPDSRPIDPSSDWLAVFADPEDNLPGARKEGAEIASAYPSSRTYIGHEAATAAAFLSECAQANLLHIAAHHRLDANPVSFQLLLAAGGGSEGTVGLQELSAVNNQYLQLVVLSACNSIGSADPISLGPARAAEVFSLIGAKSVLGGLWKVSDDAASRIMSVFYQGLSRGKSRAEALQSAQRSMVESRQFAHPFYWACFALYGNPK